MSEPNNASLAPTADDGAAGPVRGEGPNSKACSLCGANPPQVAVEFTCLMPHPNDESIYFILCAPICFGHLAEYADDLLVAIAILRATGKESPDAAIAYAKETGMLQEIRDSRQETMTITDAKIAELLADLENVATLNDLTQLIVDPLTGYDSILRELARARAHLAALDKALSPEKSEHIATCPLLGPLEKDDLRSYAALRREFKAE